MKSGRTGTSVSRFAVISVVIPVLNGGSDLARCLDALATQVVDDEVEVVVVDSGSTDGASTLAARAGRACTRSRPSEFNHGGTRNLGASLARGEVVVFTSQDAYAADEHWLARLTAPLADPSVAGAYGRQIAHEEAHPPEVFFIDFLYGPRSRVQRGGGAVRADDGDDAVLERRTPRSGARCWSGSRSSTTSS